MLRIFSHRKKSNGFGRVRTRELGNQRPAVWYAGQEGTPDDEHRVARNVYRSEIINTLKKCVKLVINRNCAEMRGQ
jgi:hypothetical protein